MDKSDSTRPGPLASVPMLLRRVAFPDFCEPLPASPAAKPPAGAGRLHEIKHDGFRMLAMACDDGNVRKIRRCNY
jgi:bifunctional non-homologous end joining protein LigD